jgi:hypothetical protein
MALTQFIRRLHRRTVGSSGAEDFAAETLLLPSSRRSVYLVLLSYEPPALCLELTDRRMNCCLPVGLSSVEDSCLGMLLSCSN